MDREVTVLTVTLHNLVINIVYLNQIKFNKLSPLIYHNVQLLN